VHPVMCRAAEVTAHPLLVRLPVDAAALAIRLPLDLHREVGEVDGEVDDVLLLPVARRSAVDPVYTNVIEPLFAIERQLRLRLRLGLRGRLRLQL
jgi:hypothetical protein